MTVQYQVRIRGWEPQPLYSNKRTACADARVLAAQERRPVTVYRFDRQGSTHVATYGPTT